VPIRDDSDAFRESFLVAGGLGGFKPECDFCPLRLPGFEASRLLLGGGVGDNSGWRVCERDGGRSGGDCDSRIFCSCFADDVGGFAGIGDLERAKFALEGGRSDDGRANGALLLRLKWRRG
jgi:hypothetical protein